MFIFLLRRILFIFPLILAVTLLVFGLVRFVPGGPFASERELDVSVQEQLNEQYGLDRPFLVQYGRYIYHLCHGDLGPSVHYSNWDVHELMSGKISISAELGVYSFLFSVVFGVLFGVLCAYFRGKFFDRVCNFLSTIGICLPSFVIGPVLVYLFSIKLHLFSVAGWTNWQDKVLPTLTVGVMYASYIFRLTRGGIIDVLGKLYITAARARGVPEWRIFFIHALKNGLLPVVTYLGPAFAGIISGAIVTETIFQIPGLGRLFLQAINYRDDMLILGIVNFYALAIILCSTATDCIQLLINPRSKMH